MSDDDRIPHGAQTRWGYYDAHKRGFVHNAEDLSPADPVAAIAARQAAAAASRRTALDDGQMDWRNRPLTDRERAEQRAAGFKPDPNMENLIRLRDSDRARDQDQGEKMIRGTTRMSLGDYERQRAEHLAAGGELPDGVSRQ